MHRFTALTGIVFAYTGSSREWKLAGERTEKRYRWEKVGLADDEQPQKTEVSGRRSGGYIVLPTTTGSRSLWGIL